MMPYGRSRRTTSCTTSSSCSRSDAGAASAPPTAGVAARIGELAATLARRLALFGRALAWAALAPIVPARATSCSRSRKGTWARRMAGDKVEILPDTIRLTLGINDVLLLRNLDDVPQVFGPALIMPGQSFRLPFARRVELQLRLHGARQRADDA